MADKLIKLNFGGVTYVTTRTTLCTYPDSMLGAMFNGSMETTKDDNGCYFIDRDGELFKYILNFLRSSELALPSDFKRLDELRLESNFNQITSLKKQIEKVSKRSNSLPTYVYYLDVLEVRKQDHYGSLFKDGTSYTQMCGRKRLIVSNLKGLIDDKDLIRQSQEEFIVVKLDPRLAIGERSCGRVGEELCNNGWELINSEITTCPQDQYMKLLYNDRWSLKKFR